MKIVNIAGLTPISPERTGAPTPMTTNRYQIYSSVLGKVVTTVSPSGTSGVKKIYAGGALIASGAGDSSAGSISWKTADPVTGTVATYNYNSLGSVAAVEEESEPLEQRISPADPYENEPTAYGDVLNSPRNPEWMCEVAEQRGADFWAMPVFCQQKVLESYGTGLPDYLGVHKVENPQRIALTDSPIPRGTVSPSGASYASKAMSFALSSTDKKKTKDKRPDIELPGEHVDVRILGIDPTEIPEFRDASVGGPAPDAQPRWSISDLTSGARKVIEESLKNNPNGECAKLLKGGSLADFDDVANNISYNPNVLVGRSEGLGGRELRLGEVPNVSAVTAGREIALNPNGYAFSDTRRIVMNEAGKRSIEGLNRLFNDFGAANQWQFAIAIMIHEYLHTTGRFKPDSTVGIDGSVNSDKSKGYQKEVLKKCKDEISKVSEPGG